MSTRKYRSQSEWLHILQQYNTSQLTPAQFCQQNTLDLKYFLKRKRALQVKKPAPSANTSFLKVQSVPSQPQVAAGAGPVLQYQAVQLHITVDTDPHWLAQLMKSLS